MNQLQLIFAVLAGLVFVLPFFIGGFLRFGDKQHRNIVGGHKRFLQITFLISFGLFLIFIFLAIFI